MTSCLYQSSVLKIDDVFDHLFVYQFQKQMEIEGDSNPLNWARISRDIAIDANTQFEQSKFGSVQRGYSFFRDEVISIKILPKVHTSEEYIKTLEECGKLDHQYIMGYYGCLQYQQNYYFCLQYCPFGTLQKLIQKKLTQKECLRLFRQIVEAMEYMHDHKMLHRDLKPQNILVGRYQDIKLCYFGLNDDENSGIWETGKYGTAIYAAPEVFLHEIEEDQYTEQGDMWSVGLICYEMLTGEHLMKNIQNYDELKEEWLKIERGNSRIALSSSYHALWSCFFNCIFNFQPLFRPSFKTLATQIRQIYPKMSLDLSQQLLKFSPPLQTLSNYLAYTLKKYDILLNLCELFTSKDIRLRNECKYFMIFCCIMRYRAFFRDFSAKIEKKEIRVNGQQLLSGQDKKECYVEFVLMEGLSIAKQKEKFYSHQVKTAVIPKILTDYCERKDSQQIIDELPKIVDLIKKASKEDQLQEETEYEEAFQSILKVIQRKHGDVTQFYTQKELRIYFTILVAMLISQKFPEDRYQELDLFSIQSEVELMTREELVKGVKTLSQRVF